MDQVVAEMVVRMELQELLTQAVVEVEHLQVVEVVEDQDCLLYTSPSPRDGLLSRMPSSA